MSEHCFLIKGATVLPFTRQADGSLNLQPQTLDVLVEGDRIAQVAPVVEVTDQTVQVIPASHQLLIPGFVNAHAHSMEILGKGNYEALPLELWMLYSYPPLQSKHLSPRLCYLRTLIGAMEMVKYGGTTIQDDLLEVPYSTPEHFAAAGDRVTVVVPADRIHMTPEHQAENRVRAILRGREFMGSQVIYLLETDTGYEIKVIRQETFSTSLAIPINTELWLHWQTKDTVLLGERLIHPAI